VRQTHLHDADGFPGKVIRAGRRRIHAPPREIGRREMLDEDEWYTLLCICSATSCDSVNPCVGPEGDVTFSLTYRATYFENFAY
jgi:hypothetical protein